EVDASRAARPGGRRFGVLVHAILAAVDFTDAREATVQALARQQGRIVGASDAEVRAAADTVVQALASPLLRRAAAALEVRRETPVWLRRADGTLAEGVVDLAFREAAGWVVVDFKTDRELAERRAVYAAQVALYAEAVAAATGLPARGVLLQV
ncbi:MAG: PD-(D/E)XK nuclease family protein, partial [Myxococcota bacterium]|nr:PD-(D/E)XK nuclease family protein [Myxococcota bacterium]